ncbi:PilX N-terminal domain-containing pilus assembly protein [Salinisphaera sp. P385]|uniref:PilX N-terminal domain-containing pilus assembly protein n=1 Tax=Spectribacter acetivorans TaxID=3075603 RepID=A0ABU3B598_9GAMM|nr:PilX N-terminal domain-containing pilus assembly protein [Salinisphaera sp. P385]MDT0617310.1 PilX N-terminal domain-containing pilus assembly protein [Salinisphaera sp. P385]
MMRYQYRQNPQQGFVLITGMIFLIVITLLALSTMGSTTLQERMTSNQREQFRALQASDAALRDGERRLAQLVNYPEVGRNHEYDPTPAEQETDDTESWRLWFEDVPLTGVAQDAGGFLAAEPWDRATKSDEPEPILFQFYKAGETVNASTLGLAELPRLYIEEVAFRPDDLDPETAARAEGSTHYRVTGRARGGNPSATAVTQSIYQKRY